MKALALILIASLPAAAEPWTCTFTALCAAGAACADTDWRVNIDVIEGGFRLWSETGETPLVPIGTTGRAYAAPDMLLTIAQEGTATLTAHDTPARSYLGRCEDLS